MEDDDDLMRVQEAEEFFGHVSRSTLWRWEKAGEIPKKNKIGGSNFWLRSEANAWRAAKARRGVISLPDVPVSPPPETFKKQRATLAALPATFDDTSFLKISGLHMPLQVAEQIDAAIDNDGGLTYRTVSGGRVTCGDEAAIDPRSVIITGAVTFSVAGNTEAKSWTIVESLRDLLVIGKLGGIDAEEGYVILNKPATAKRASNYLRDRAASVCIMLPMDTIGDKTTSTLLSLLPAANDMRSMFPE